MFKAIVHFSTKTSPIEIVTKNINIIASMEKK